MSSSTYTAPRRPRDMMLSLAVIIVPIALLLGGWRLLTGGDDVNPVDAGPAYEEAVRAGLPVLRPQGLPDEWQATFTNVDKADGAVTLRVSYHTPDDAGVQLVQSSGDAAALISDRLGASPHRDGAVEVAGAAWESYVAQNGNAALVWTADGRTVLIVGDAEQAELLELATALK